MSRLFRSKSAASFSALLLNMHAERFAKRGESNMRETGARNRGTPYLFDPNNVSSHEPHATVPDSVLKYTYTNTVLFELAELEQNR